MKDLLGWLTSNREPSLEGRQSEVGGDVSVVVMSEALIKNAGSASVPAINRPGASATPSGAELLLCDVTQPTGRLRPRLAVPPPHQGGGRMKALTPGEEGQADIRSESLEK